MNSRDFKKFAVFLPHSKNKPLAMKYAFPYTSICIRLCHLSQGYHDYCVVTTNDGEVGGGGWFIYIRVWVGAQGVGIVNYCC